MGKGKEGSKRYALPALTMKDQVVETAKAAVLGGVMGFIMSWLVASFLMAFPADASANAMNNAMSGLMSGVYGGLWGMVMFFVTMHLRQKKLSREAAAGAAQAEVPEAV